MDDIAYRMLRNQSVEIAQKAQVEDGGGPENILQSILNDSNLFGRRLIQMYEAYILSELLYDFYGHRAWINSNSSVEDIVKLETIAIKIAEHPKNLRENPNLNFDLSTNDWVRDQTFNLYVQRKVENMMYDVLY